MKTNQIQNQNYLSAYLRSIRKLGKPNDWYDLRRRSMRQIQTCLGDQSLRTVTAPQMIQFVCDGARHWQTGEPHSYDRVRHILEHTKEFLLWMCIERPRVMRSVTVNDLRDWHGMATAANRVRTPAPEPGASFPSAEDLELFVWGVPTTVVAQAYGVSDVAVGKWCRARNVSKPPRGFWARYYADPDPVIDMATLPLILGPDSPAHLRQVLSPMREAIQARREWFAK